MGSPKLLSDIIIITFIIIIIFIMIINTQRKVEPVELGGAPHPSGKGLPKCCWKLAGKEQIWQVGGWPLGTQTWL